MEEEFFQKTHGVEKHDQLLKASGQYPKGRMKLPLGWDLRIKRAAV